MLAATNPMNPGTAIPAGSSSPPHHRTPGFGGVAIYDSQNGTPNPWELNGGTSLSSPAFAGLIAIGDQLRQSVGEAPLSTSQAQQILYSLPSSAFHDITVGQNLVPYSAGPGYDLVTGRGSPVANLLVPALAGPVLTSLQREGIHQQTTIDLSFLGAGPGVGPGPRQLHAAGAGPSWGLLPPDPPAFSDLQRGDPDGGARAEAAVPESHVRAAGQGHAAARAEGREGHPPGRRQPEGDLQRVHPFQPGKDTPPDAG